ncbi:MAG: hypothetical protein ABIH21_03540 [Patescibacteria group bacterium]
MKTQIPNTSFQIINWYAFEKELNRKLQRSFEQEFDLFLKNITVRTNKSDRDWEFNQMKYQFAFGKYFGKLEKPDDSILKDWIERKFAEYAVQASWIREFLPNAILIQNEKPSDLRTAMYQPQVQARFKENFPVLYLLGVDNNGYQ